MTAPDRDQLLELLEALCEERLTAPDRDRVEQAVLHDAQARRLYLDYVDLHGTLYWDAAADTRGEQLEPRLAGGLPGHQAPTAPVHRNSRRTLYAAGAAAAL